MYFKSKNIPNITSENIEKKIRSHSIRRYPSLDYKFTSTYDEEVDKSFFGLEKPKAVYITRIRTPFLKFAPKIIVKFDKSNFKEYKIRFGAFTFLMFIYFSVALILNLFDSINSNSISENLLLILIGNVIFYSFIFMEYKTIIKRIDSIINL